MPMGKLPAHSIEAEQKLTKSHNRPCRSHCCLCTRRIRVQCYIGWARLKKALNADKMKEYKFTLKPRFMPYLINESLDKDPVTKEQLYSEKFMGTCRASSHYGIGIHESRDINSY